ncbi:hypothetical protein OVA29_10705 [Exiguobacterium sp. SL14]|nr:hypothetical protein [Exiguobacterium sp. SL14]MCY1691087.1 hypothetical protein [Exiguobacterium sp. SL14]
MIDFSIATADDAEAIHELNYLTFTEEIPHINRTANGGELTASMTRTLT